MYYNETTIKLLKHKPLSLSTLYSFSLQKFAATLIENAIENNEKVKYLFDALQQLLSSSTNDDRPRSQRHLLWSMQAEHRIRLCTYGKGVIALVCGSI